MGNYAGPPAPVWYSLPGKCPSAEYTDKTEACVEAEHGGECLDPDGTKNCTWTAKYAGEIRLDELSGITDYESFWNMRRDPVKCRERVARVEQMFKSRYPSWPLT